MKCPRCGSEDVGALMAAFWVPVDGEGDPKLAWGDMESETELGPERLCYVCNHEWSVDE